jgi:hypothetical protein
LDLSKYINYGKKSYTYRWYSYQNNTNAWFV